MVGRSIPKISDPRREAPRYINMSAEGRYWGNRPTYRTMSYIVWWMCNRDEPSLAIEITGWKSTMRMTPFEFHKHPRKPCHNCACVSLLNNRWPMELQFRFQTPCETGSAPEEQWVQFEVVFRCSSREEKKTFPASEEAIKVLLYHSKRCAGGTESGCTRNHPWSYPVVPPCLADLAVTEKWNFSRGAVPRGHPSDWQCWHSLLLFVLFL